MKSEEIYSDISIIPSYKRKKNYDKIKLLQEEWKPYLSIIIPCYNEEKNLERGVLDEIYQYLYKQDYTWEVIIINDESTDNSKNLIKRFVQNKKNFSMYSIPHGGKPIGIRAGVQKAMGEIVLFTDMDQSTPINELNNLLFWINKGFDVVIGSRGNRRNGFSITRKAGSLIFRAIRRIFLLRNISDTQCGFKLCRRQAALAIFPLLQYFKQKKKFSGWRVSAYDVELLYLFQKLGYSIKEVKVNWNNVDVSDTKKQKGELTRYLRESIEMAQEIIRIKINQTKGLYRNLCNRSIIDSK